LSSGFSAATGIAIDRPFTDGMVVGAREFSGASLVVVVDGKAEILVLLTRGEMVGGSTLSVAEAVGIEEEGDAVVVVVVVVVVVLSPIGAQPQLPFRAPV